MGFEKRWKKAVVEKDSVLCAGLDPAKFEMGRGKKGLPKGACKTAWSKAYIEAVSPFAAAIKPNTQYWKDKNDMENLYEVIDFAHSLDLVVIEDSKLADIGSTNDAGFFYAAQKHADAITFSPFAGNMCEAAKMAEGYDMGLIPMCIMSNPEYETEKNKLVRVDETEMGDFRPRDVVTANIDECSVPHVRQYVQLARNAEKYKAAAVVIGAPSESNHIKESEVADVAHYYHGLVLLPGVGAQGGEANFMWKYFPSDSVIVNVGRDLMLQHGANTTPGQQAQSARAYQDMLNRLRTED